MIEKTCPITKLELVNYFNNAQRINPGSYERKQMDQSS